MITLGENTAGTRLYNCVDAYEYNVQPRATPPLPSDHGRAGLREELTLRS